MAVNEWRNLHLNTWIIIELNTCIIVDLGILHYALVYRRRSRVITYFNHLWFFNKRGLHRSLLLCCGLCDLCIKVRLLLIIHLNVVGLGSCSIFNGPLILGYYLLLDSCHVSSWNRRRAYDADLGWLGLRLLAINRSGSHVNMTTSWWNLKFKFKIII